MLKSSVFVVIAVLALSRMAVAQDAPTAAPKTAKEHEFLKQFAGEWDCDGKAYIELGKPPVEMKSSMTGHLIGEFWAIAIIKGDAFGQPYHGQGTFGYDSRKKKYVGTWADSMSDFLWHYEGTVEGDKLVLNSEGPDPSAPGKMMKARDTWHFKSKDMLVITGQMEGPDGKWLTMMTATCKRKQ